jgi:hypothetical protein
MADPANIDIVVPTRRAPFEDYYSFFDENFTGSSFLFQVREIKDTTGAPIFDGSLGVVLQYAGTATVAAHVTAGRLFGSGTDNVYEMVNPATGVRYVAGDNVLLSQVKIGLDVATLDDVPFPAERGDDWVGWHDMIRTPASGPDLLLMRGSFIVQAAVSIP